MPNGGTGGGTENTAAPKWSSVLDPSRSHDVPQSHFAKNAEGVLNVDVRRDFVRVGKGYPEQKPWALKWLGRIRELYRLNRERLKHAPGSAEFTAAEAKLREEVAMMAIKRDAELSLAELSPAKLHYACPPVLKSLSEHWTGLTLFAIHFAAKSEKPTQLRTTRANFHTHLRRMFTSWNS